MIAKVLRDPFIHFILLGLLVFLIADKEFIFSSAAVSPKAKIVIDEKIENLLVLKFEANQSRSPNDLELQQLIDQYIREEVLVREAMKLGLDKNDHVIRARLVELIDSIGLANNQVGNPSEDQLRQLAQHSPMRYSTGGSFSLEQIFLGTEPSGELISNTKIAIENGTTPASLSVNSKFAFRLNNASKEAVIGMFGGNFLQVLMEAELGKWAGPIKSPAGVHLVKVVNRENPTIPPIEQIKELLASDWLILQRRSLLDKLYQDYRSNYEVHKDSD